MRLVFSVSGKLFIVRVSDKRELFFSSDLTNNKEISFVDESLKQGNNVADTRLAAAIVRDLVDVKDVERYVISEFSKQGLVHVKTEW